MPIFKLDKPHQYREFFQIINVPIVFILVLSAIKYSYVLNLDSKLQKKNNINIENIKKNKLTKLQKSIYDDFKKDHYTQGKIIRSEWKNYKKTKNNLYKSKLTLWSILTGISIGCIIIIFIILIYLNYEIDKNNNNNNY